MLLVGLVFIICQFFLSLFFLSFCVFSLFHMCKCAGNLKDFILHFNVRFISFAGAPGSPQNWYCLSEYLTVLWSLCVASIGDLVGRRHFHPVQPVFLQATLNQLFFWLLGRDLILEIQAYYTTNTNTTNTRMFFFQVLCSCKAPADSTRYPQPLHLLVSITTRTFCVKHWKPFFPICWRKTNFTVLDICCITSSPYHYHLQLSMQILGKMWHFTSLPFHPPTIYFQLSTWSKLTQSFFSKGWCQMHPFLLFWKVISSLNSFIKF